MLITNVTVKYQYSLYVKIELLLQKRTLSHLRDLQVEEKTDLLMQTVYVTGNIMIDNYKQL